jgi:hypothetical protein
MFTFGKNFLSGGDAAKPANVDEHATEPGAQSAAPDSGGVSAHAVAAARANAEAQLSQSPRAKRQYKRRDSGTGGDTEQALQNQVNAAIAAQLDTLHDPALWGALLSAPADTARFLTGHEHWQVQKEERALLGSAGSAAARVMMITNPRMLAFSLAAAAICNVYLPRVLQEARLYAEAKRKKEKEAKADEPKSS